jgi:hypothetical protein
MTPFASWGYASTKRRPIKALVLIEESDADYTKKAPAQNDIIKRSHEKLAFSRSLSQFPALACISKIERRQNTYWGLSHVTCMTMGQRPLHELLPSSEIESLQRRMTTREYRRILAQASDRLRLAGLVTVLAAALEYTNLRTASSTRPSDARQGMVFRSGQCRSASNDARQSNEPSRLPRYPH